MVSLLSNAGVKYYLSQTEPQYPCYLYDSYLYPTNLNRIDYQQNLSYPQNQLAIEQNKTKKSRKKSGNEKNSKETVPNLEYSKDDLFKW